LKTNGIETRTGVDTRLLPFYLMLLHDMKEREMKKQRENPKLRKESLTALLRKKKQKSDVVKKGCLALKNFLLKGGGLQLLHDSST
jgi:hypothetical protein